MVRALRAIKGSEEEHDKKDRFWDTNDSVHFRVTWRAEMIWPTLNQKHEGAIILGTPGRLEAMHIYAKQNATLKAENDTFFFQPVGSIFDVM